MRKSIRALALGVVALFTLGAAACGGAPGDDSANDHGAVTSLTVTPAQSEHTILNGEMPSQAFTAEAVFADGTTEDVTAQTLFGVDTNIGAFTDHTLTMGAPGKGTVTAVYGEQTGAAQVIVHLSTVRLGAGVDPSVPGLFNAATADATRAPTVVYPPVGVVVPRNLGDFEVHWNDASTNNVYELSLKTELTDVRVYLTGGNGAANTGPNPTWAAFTAQEWADAVDESKTTAYMVRGLDTASPTTVGSSDSRTVALTNEPLEGGIYYWASQDTTGVNPEGIWRHDMAKPGEPAEQFFTVTQTAGRCVACHALSRDGTKMAVTWDGGNQPSSVVDVATQTAMPDAVDNWNFATFTPDTTKMITVFNGVFTIRDAATMLTVGAPMPVEPAGTRVSHPDLSADGTKLVYTHDVPDSDFSFRSGTVWTRTFDQAANTFGPEIPLVMDGVNNYYPSWSPDGKWILFNRTDDAAGTSYNNAGASLWVVKADGSAPPVQLIAANAMTGLTNSWGRWAPFAQSVGTTSEPIFWVTVSSQRQFGVRHVAGLPQIWMTPFYPDRASTGMDPSAPAFRLPFQNLSTNNHIAQWTEKVIVLSKAVKAAKSATSSKQ